MWGAGLEHGVIRGGHFWERIIAIFFQFLIKINFVGKKGPYYIVILGQKSEKRTMFFGEKVDIVETQKAIFVDLCWVGR